MEEREKLEATQFHRPKKIPQKCNTTEQSHQFLKWKNGILYQERKKQNAVVWSTDFSLKRQDFAKKECQTSAGKYCAWWCLYFKSYLYIETHEILNLYADCLSAHITNNVVEMINKIPHKIL